MAGALVFLDAKRNSGGTKGTTVNHLGFQVPDLREAVGRVKAAGFPMVTREEITAVPPEAVKDDMAFNPFMETLVAMTMGPEGTKVELVENPALSVPIAIHHVHFFNPAQQPMRDWYVGMFGAVARQPWEIPDGGIARRQPDGLRITAACRGHSRTGHRPHRVRGRPPRGALPEAAIGRGKTRGVRCAAGGARDSLGVRDRSVGNIAGADRRAPAGSELDAAAGPPIRTRLSGLWYGFRS